MASLRTPILMLLLVVLWMGRMAACGGGAIMLMLGLFSFSFRFLGGCGGELEGRSAECGV